MAAPRGCALLLTIKMAIDHAGIRLSTTAGPIDQAATRLRTVGEAQGRSSAEVRETARDAGQDVEDATAAAASVADITPR